MRTRRGRGEDEWKAAAFTALEDNPGLGTGILELGGMKLPPSDPPFICVNPQVHKSRSEPPGGRDALHAELLLKRSSSAIRSYKHVQLLNSSNNGASLMFWASETKKNHKKPQKHFSLFGLCSFRENLHAGSCTAAAKHRCMLHLVRTELRPSARVWVFFFFFLFCVKLNKRPVSHLAGC